MEQNSKPTLTLSLTQYPLPQYSITDVLINQPELKWSPKFSKCLDVPFSAGEVNVDDDDDGAVVCTTDFSFATFQFLLLPTFVLDEHRFPEAATKPNT